jgi:rhodanese-related sulfurtransferase
MDHSPRFLKLVEEVQSRVKEIGVEETARLVKGGHTYLIDVREDAEWAASHAVGAIHIGKGVLERDIEKRVPELGAPILLYCGGGYRSTLAADALQQMGYTNVRSVTGGWRAWLASRLPTTRKPEAYPRSAYEKLGGVVHLPRLIDKARLIPAGKLPGYTYLTSGFDKFLIDFLCLEGKAFEAEAQQASSDEEILRWIKRTVGPAWPSDHAIAEFNERLSKRRPDTAEKQAKFDQMRAEMPPTRHRIETYFDLFDLEEGRFKDQ